MKFLKSTLPLAIALFFLCDVNAQIELTDTLTVSELVNEHLLGEGVEATNITFNGLSGDSVTVQVMLFEDTTATGDFNSSVDFQKGIIMATGFAGSVLPNGDFGTPEYPITNDPDLVAIANQNINDAAIIEFDFIVKADSVKFDYVFASTEYPNFTCDDFNDAFGFFLSGPGLVGAFSDDAINIANIPGTDIPVAINTINGGVPTGNGEAEICEAANPNWVADSVYFVNNEIAEAGDFNVPGMTVTLQALAAVEICEEYHIKLAIGDAFDGALDSYVFLKAGSFSAIGEISADFNNVFASDSSSVTQAGYDTIAIAGCTNPIISLTRPSCACFKSIEYSFSDDGNAVFGEDFETTGQFPPPSFDSLGVDVINVELATLDSTETDTLNVIFVIDFITCEGIIGQTIVEIPIAPAPEIVLTTEDITLICPTDSVAISVVAENGVLPYVYDWEEMGDPGEFTDNEVFIETDIPGADEGFIRQYKVNVRDKCDFKESTDSLLLINNIPPPLETSINPFAQPTCPNEPVDLEVSVNNGNPPYFFQWSDSDDNNYSEQPFSSVVVDEINESVLGFTPELEVFSIITDSCGTQISDSVTINYPLYDTLAVSFTPLFDNCPEGPVQLESEASAGAGDYTYTWTIEGESTVTDGSNLNTSTTFIDAGRGFNTFRISVEDRCHRLEQSLDYRPSSTGEFFSLGKDTASITIPYIKLDPLQNIITPNGDGQNEVLIIPGIDAFEDASVLIYDRWGKLIYESNSYDAGTGEATVSQGFSADGFSDGSYFYVVNIDSGECVAQGNLQVVGGNE